MDTIKKESKTAEEKPEKNRGMLKGFVLGILLAGLIVGGMFIFLTMQPNKEKQIRDTIADSYLNEVEEEVITEGAYKGMVNAINDPYAEYYTQEEYEKTTQELEGTYFGIGVVIQENKDTRALTIVRCYADAPGAKAGIREGDIIYKIGDEFASEIGMTEVVKRIQESAGGSVHLTLVREGMSDYVEVDAVPEEVEEHTVDYKMMEDKVGYLAIYSFNQTTSHQFQEALEDMKSQGMERLIVDLRSNTGGLMMAVTEILDSILPEGTIVYTMDKDGNRLDYKGEGKTPLEIPMVVLTNEYTASASEIFAGAVRDYDMAKLVGTKTYGKGVVQDIFSLSDGSAVKLTIANYYTPSGVNLNDSGLKPDVEVELNTQPQEDGTYVDNQLEKAMETVKNM